MLSLVLGHDQGIQFVLKEGQAKDHNPYYVYKNFTSSDAGVLTL